HYVGALQVGDLIIEVLPKTDRKRVGDEALWHGVLLDMLRYCQLIKVDALTSARLRLRSNSILELYFEIFLTEVEQLLRQGLCKAYHLEQGNRKNWKGKLLFAQQINHNHIHQQRFYTEHDRYDFDHPANRMLYQALLTLSTLLMEVRLQQRLKKIIARFPKFPPTVFREQDFQAIRYTRSMTNYRKALEIARLLLLNYSPDIRGGGHNALAIMFDMNVLFEEYVFQQLRRGAPEGLTVQRQQQTNFWNRRQIRPDLLVEYQGKRFVLDTKWKLLKKAQPSMEDLKQMYVYCRFFNATQSVLLYPHVATLQNCPPTPYQSVEASAETYYCAVLFLRVVEGRQLNRQLGKALIQQLDQALSSTAKAQST
ncbi:MAG: restriction endonuclease, partial [Bacteroidota bacterium]